MDPNLLNPQTVLVFLLLFFRIGGLIAGGPLLSNQGIPAQLKVGLTLALALLFFPVCAAQGSAQLPTDLFQFTWIAVREFGLGLMLGFAANLLFSGIQMAGEYVALQMGLSVSNILDPLTHVQVPVLGQFYFFFAITLFLTLNIHHSLILALNHSFELVPLAQPLSAFGLVAERFSVLGNAVFAMALMVGAPTLGLLLVVEIALAFVAKVMPQMNIFMVGIPLKVGVGLFALMVSLPLTAGLLSDRFAEMVRQLMTLFRV